MSKSTILRRILTVPSDARRPHPWARLPRTGAKFGRAALGVTLCAALSGCGSVEPVAYSGIASSSYLQPDRDDDTGHIAYRYATSVNWRGYHKVMVDPVSIYRGPDSQFDDMAEEDKTALAHYLQSQFAEKLAARFTLTNIPGPHTLRIKLTLTGAATTTPVLGTLSHFDIAGGLYNGVQSIRGGEGTLTGSVLYAVEIYDAATSVLLTAYISKQYPGAMNIGASLGSLAAAETGIEKGADALVEQLK